MYFTVVEMMPVDYVPIKPVAGSTSSALSGWLQPLLFSQAVSGSCTHARMHTSRGQSCHFRGHCQISASSVRCGSAPYNRPRCFQSAGLLLSCSPTVSTGCVYKVQPTWFQQQVEVVLIINVSHVNAPLMHVAN